MISRAVRSDAGPGLHEGRVSADQRGEPSHGEDLSPVLNTLTPRSASEPRSHPMHRGRYPQGRHAKRNTACPHLMRMEARDSGARDGSCRKRSGWPSLDIRLPETGRLSLWPWSGMSDRHEFHDRSDRPSSQRPAHRNSSKIALIEGSVSGKTSGQTCRTSRSIGLTASRSKIDSHGPGAPC